MKDMPRRHGVRPSTQRCAVLSLFFVINWVKETKGMELEDMKDEMMIAPH